MNYLTAKDNYTETVISKSRFLTYVYEIRDAEDAVDKLNALRKRYYDSTHVCYAYIADILGNEFKFSDDGEPSGTAGIPIYEAIKGGGFRKTLVAVVRYFGGIKLGAGGLVRAYSGCAAECLASASKGRYVASRVYELVFDIGLYSKVSRCLSQRGRIIDQEFTQKVKLKVALPEETDTAFIDDSTNGQCEINQIYSDFFDYGTNSQ